MAQLHCPRQQTVRALEILPSKVDVAADVIPFRELRIELDGPPGER
jgi:hypothetical protein